MKTKLIMHDTPIIVSNEEIKKGVWYYDELDNTLRQLTFNPLTDLRGSRIKIIAGIEGLPSIDWNGLEEEFGWVDVEKIAKELDKTKYRNFRREYTLKETYEGIEDGFIAGFKKAQSLNEKKFSLEDMKKCWNTGGLWQNEEGDISFEQYIQSLQQPKVFDIEVEMLSDSPYDPRSKTGRFEVGDTDKVVVRNNSIKILSKL